MNKASKKGVIIVDAALNPTSITIRAARWINGLCCKMVEVEVELEPEAEFFSVIVKIIFDLAR
jgi:hypothetical protein